MKSDLELENQEVGIITVLNAQLHSPGMSDAVDVLRVAMQAQSTGSGRTPRPPWHCSVASSRPRQSKFMKPHPGANRTTLRSAFCCWATTQGISSIEGGPNGVPVSYPVDHPICPGIVHCGYPLRGP